MNTRNASIILQNQTASP